MTKIALAAAALSLALAAPAAVAQTAPAATTPAAMAPGQIRAKAILERDVHSSDGQKIGEVEDMVLDAQGRVVGVVVEVEGGLLRGDRHVMVPFERVRLGDRRLELPMTRDEIRAMPGFAHRD